ncbi:unnamed protein product, partial [Prorocentrum cordatum]
RGDAAVPRAAARVCPRARRPPRRRLRPPRRGWPRARAPADARASPRGLVLGLAPFQPVLLVSDRRRPPVALSYSGDETRDGSARSTRPLAVARAPPATPGTSRGRTAWCRRLAGGAGPSTRGRAAGGAMRCTCRSPPPCPAACRRGRRPPLRGSRQAARRKPPLRGEEAAEEGEQREVAEGGGRAGG